MRHDEAVPQVDRDKLADDLRSLLPHATVDVETISRDYASWRITVKQGSAWVDVFWGPQSGFGATDLNDRGDDPDPFVAYDHPMDGAAAAVDFVVRTVRRGVA